MHSGKHDPRGWVVVGVEVIHSGRNARSTREWGVATTSASVVTGYMTVPTAHEVMNFFLPHFLCEDVHTLQVYDVRHTKFNVVLSLHSQGKWGHVWSFTGFLCNSDLAGKHLSDPTVLWQLPAKEPKNSIFTVFFLSDHKYAGPAQLSSSGGRGDTFRSECEGHEGVGRGHCER